uniref:F-box domain-containing protein n=1 Tax=Timema tahoe TaxID=61484 RepID=A0A7R9IJW3_9NEOP|nr:unnamed protein product [Timema tahoe]
MVSKYRKLQWQDMQRGLCSVLTKRMKMNDADESKMNNGLDYWSGNSDVEPDLLEDMGLSILDDKSENRPDNFPPLVVLTICAPKSSFSGNDLEPNLGTKSLEAVVELPSLASGTPEVSGLRPCNALKKTCVTGVNSKEAVVDHFDSQMAQENIPTPESFFIFRRKKPTADDAFSKLSDEMVLTIFRHMPKKSLVRCAFVCKRWRRIAYDESLWSRLDLSLRTLRPGNLGYTLVRGVSILRLAQAEGSELQIRTVVSPTSGPEIQRGLHRAMTSFQSSRWDIRSTSVAARSNAVSSYTKLPRTGRSGFDSGQVSDPVFECASPLVTKEYDCKLQYLDLSMAVISKRVRVASQSLNLSHKHPLVATDHPARPIAMVAIPSTGQVPILPDLWSVKSNTKPLSQGGQKVRSAAGETHCACSMPFALLTTLVLQVWCRADEAYKAKLWSYDLLIFTKDDETPRESISNINSCDDQIACVADEDQHTSMGDTGEKYKHKLFTASPLECHGHDSASIDFPPSERANLLKEGVVRVRLEVLREVLVTGITATIVILRRSLHLVAIAQLSV